jgi:hypothetical protein
MEYLYVFGALILGAYLGTRINRHDWVVIGLGMATVLPIGWAIYDSSGWFLLATPIFALLLMLRRRSRVSFEKNE